MCAEVCLKCVDVRFYYLSIAFCPTGLSNTVEVYNAQVILIALWVVIQHYQRSEQMGDLQIPQTLDYFFFFFLRDYF